MIISPKHGFVFVHIPKCAGTSIRRQLGSCDEDAVSLAEAGSHPVLGRIDYGHVPLTTLRTHFPEHFAELRRLDAFAVVRDPLERFGSALRQSLWQFEKRPMTLIPHDELRELALRLLDDVAHGFGSLQPRYIFFSRQRDFILDGGEQVVKVLVPLDLVPDLLGYLSRRTGMEFDTGRRSNQNVELRYKGLGNLAYRANDILRRRLPAGLHEGIKRQALKVLAGKGSAAEASGILELPEVRAFVAEHYREDIDIYRRVSERGEAIRKALRAGDLQGAATPLSAPPHEARAATAEPGAGRSA